MQQPDSTIQKIFGGNPYGTLVEEVRDFAIFLLDLEGHIVSWNQGAQLIFGYEPEEIIGQPFARLFVIEDQQEGVPQQELHTAQNQGRAEDVRWHVKKDGSRFWANGVTTPLRDETGLIRGFAKILRNDTPHKQAEIEREDLLRRFAFERERLSSIFQNSPAFIAVLRGEEQVFEMANPTYYQLVGHREIVGKPLLEALPEIVGQGFLELLNGVLHSGQPFEGHEVPVKLQREPHGPIEERIVDLLYLPLVEADGTISGVFSHGVDVTDQVELRRTVEESQREAEDANRLKDEFLATLSHELRTPLNSILGWANLLQGGQLSPEDAARGLSTIERNARAQAQLIEDILDVSRLITGKMRLDVQPVDLVHIIEDTINTVLPATQAKDIRLQRVLDSGSMMVSGDPARLQQIVWNLLSNAIKFTPKGGRVQIRLERVNSHIEISVADTGMGITDEVLPHIFERFRQADSTSTRTHGGLGLGLSIVRHMAELHGGSIEAYSAGLGQGSVFTLSLPLVAVREQNGPSENAQSRVHQQTHVNSIASAHGPRLNGIHALVVDDQEDTRTLLAVVLERYGARVTAVDSAAAAVTALEALRPDVLLSDIGMPEEDGYSLIKRVRELSPERGGQTPAVALTAFARTEDRVRALRSGFQIHLSKPVDATELATVVSSIVGHHSENN